MTDDVPDRVYRVTVRGRFHELGDEQRRYLVRTQPEHDIVVSAFTPEGTFTYDERIAFFNLRYEVRASSEADAAAGGTAEAEAFLRTMRFGFKALKANVLDVSAIWDDVERSRPPMGEAPSSVDAYLASFPADVRDRLQALRDLVHEVVPDAGEKISYQIPTFTLGGTYLVYLAGWKQHIALYPVPADCGELEAEVAPLRDAKATLKFVHRRPLPVDLVRRLLPLLAASARDRA